MRTATWLAMSHAAILLAPATASPATPDWRLFALRVGHCANAPRSGFIVSETLPKTLPVSFAFWVIRGEKQTVVVDTGFVSPEQRDRWQITDWRDPAEALLDLGLTTREVTDVILTHAHWDHVGGLRRFPGATLWIHEQTLKAILAGGSGPTRRAVRAARAGGRLRVTKRRGRVAPGVQTRHVGLHTAGLQVVVVDARSGRWVIASDIAPLRKNLVHLAPTGQSTHPRRAREALKTLLGWVSGEVDRVIPGHESSVFRAGPSVEATELGWVAASPWHR